MTLKDIEDSIIIKKHMEKHNIPSLEEFYFVLGEKRSKVEVIVDKLKDYQDSLKEKNIELKPVVQTPPKKSRKKNDYGIIVEGVENTLIRFAKCCTPLPGDEIGGYITKLTGIAIHRKDCKNFQNMILHEPDREIDVQWDKDIIDKKINKYQFKFSIIAEENPGLLMEIITLIANHKIVLTDINSNNSSKNGKKYIKIRIAVEISNKKDYSLLLENIKKIKYVVSVER